MNFKNREKFVQKIDEYILGIIEQYNCSTKERTLYECYKYVCKIQKRTIDDFIKSLNPEEKEVFVNNQNHWLGSLNSVAAFNTFINNNNVTF